MRNPVMRPTLGDVIIKAEEMFNTLDKNNINSNTNNNNNPNNINMNPNNPNNTNDSSITNIKYNINNNNINNNNNNNNYAANMIFNGENSGTPFYQHYTLSHALLNDSSSNPTHGQSTESDYFVQHISRITPNIFLGSESTNELFYLKFQLQITHVINCSDRSPLHSQHFDYLEAAPNSDSSSTLIHDLIPFVESALAYDGHVLFHYNGRNWDWAVTLLVAYFMATKALTYYEAFNFVRDRRYVIKPNFQLLRRLYSTAKQHDGDGTPLFNDLSGSWETKKSDKKKNNKKDKTDNNKKKRKTSQPDEPSGGGGGLHTSASSSANKDSEDAVEHTAFNPLVYNQKLQQRIKENLESGQAPLAARRRRSKPKRKERSHSGGSSRPRSNSGSGTETATATDTDGTATVTATSGAGSSPTQQRYRSHSHTSSLIKPSPSTLASRGSGDPPSSLNQE